MQNPFSWDYLTAPASRTPVWGPLSISFLVVFGIGFLVTLALYLGGARRVTRDRLQLRLLQRVSGIALIIFSVGLFFFLMRMVHISAFGLSMRLWLYLCALALLVLAGYCVYFMRARYPKLVQARDAELLKRRYLAPAGSRSAGRPRAKRKSANARRKRA